MVHGQMEMAVCITPAIPCCAAITMAAQHIVPPTSYHGAGGDRHRGRRRRQLLHRLPLALTNTVTADPPPTPRRLTRHHLIFNTGRKRQRLRSDHQSTVQESHSGRKSEDQPIPTWDHVLHHETAERLALYHQSMTSSLAAQEHRPA